MTDFQLLPRGSWTWEEFTATSNNMGALDFGPVSPPLPCVPEVVIDAESSLDPTIPIVGSAEDEPPACCRDS